MGIKLKKYFFIVFIAIFLLVALSLVIYFSYRKPQPLKEGSFDVSGTVINVSDANITVEFGQRDIIVSIDNDTEIIKLDIERYDGQEFDEELEEELEYVLRVPITLDQVKLGDVLSVICKEMTENLCLASYIEVGSE